ncbi:MAG: uracil-DNA glycosylase family protein [Tannerella sp.]|jgi:G:T/U-mismatch repair DNA glycosylase|nr:uracil-DNA glycosylase family protein [Tannerella sp.]
MNENRELKNGLNQMENGRGTVEHHPLKPFLPANAGILMLGSFPPPPERWTMNFYYPNFQNDMWRIFGIVFFNDREYFVATGGKSFDEERIKRFLTSKGIALYDTATAIIRQKGNASDRFLDIVKPLDLQELLEQIPGCSNVVTTGQKSTETLMDMLGIKQIPPPGGYVDTNFISRKLRCYRMPSSSRAYPRSLADKAEDYKKMFTAAGFL